VLPDELCDGLACRVQQVIDEEGVDLVEHTGLGTDAVSRQTIYPEACICPIFGQAEGFRSYQSRYYFQSSTCAACKAWAVVVLLKLGNVLQQS